MRLLRFRIRSMMIAVALCATALCVFALPGRRAEQFVRLIRDGNTDLALCMLNDMPDDALQYRNVVKHVSSLASSERSGVTHNLRQIEIQKPTFGQVLTCRRSVLVGQGWGGGNCELIVSLTSVRPGRNWFHVW